MIKSPFQSYLREYLPLAAKPWLVAALRQDKAVCQVATDLLTFDFAGSPGSSTEDFQLEDWSPAALALRIVAPSISPKWLRTAPMPDIDDEIKRQAMFVSNNTPLPVEDWSLEIAGWFALAIRSDYLAKGSWEPVLDTWLSDPEAQHGTILACLYGMISDPQKLFRSILTRNPSAQNIAVVLHALLSNPLTPEDQSQYLTELTSPVDDKADLPVAARLVFLHILQNQRPQLAYNLARHWLDTAEQFPTKVGWINQDPLTWFHNLEAELFQAASRQIIALEPSSVAIINEWKKLSFSPTPEESGVTVLSELVATARTQQAVDPQQALHYGQKASQYLINFLKKIPNPLLADSRLVPLMQEVSELFLTLGRPLDSETILTLACELQPVNPTLLILNARSKQKSGKTEEAVQALATALTLAPARFDICAQLAETIEAAGQWQAALTLRQALLDEVLANDQSDPSGELYALSKCALQANLPEKAFQVGQQLLQHNPKDGLGQYYCGQALFQMGKLAEAQESLTKATEMSFNQPLPWLGLSALHQHKGDQEQAMATLQAATQAVPDSPEIYLRLGEMHLQHQSYTQAQETLSLANRLAPTHPLVAYQYAVALQQLGHLDTAKDVLQQALATNPNDQQLVFAYAKCLIALGESERALPYLESILSSGQNIPVDPYIAYAQVLLTLIEKHPGQEYKPERAVEALEEAIHLDPVNHHAMALLAEALAATSNHTAALEVYQSIMDTPLIHEPDWSGRLAIGMGRTALALGKPEVAIASLQDVIQNDPEVSQPYRLLAEAYLAAHLPENALRSAQSAILLRDDDPQTIAWIVSFIKQVVGQNAIELSKPGNSSLFNQVLDDSIRTITDIIQIKPDQVGLAISLGELQVLAGDSRAARQSLITISHSNCAQPSDLIKAADHLFSLEDTQAGINSLLRAVEIETTTQVAPTTSLLVKLAKAYARAGSLQSAQETFDQAILIESSNPTLYTAKARLLLASHQSHQALECLQLASQNILSGGSNPDLHYIYAYAHLANGDLPAAIDHAQQALAAIKQARSVRADNTTSDLQTETQPIAVFTLVAELFRALLQPESARKYIDEGREFLPAAVQDLPEYIPYYCLANEMNLEAEGKVVQDCELPSKSSVASKNPRLLSLNARLTYLQGNPDQAQEFLNAARDILTDSSAHEQTLGSSVDRLDNPVPDYLSFAEAAIQLRDWDYALNILRKAGQHTHTNPLLHLTQARYYILQAEYQDLCQSCNVLRHSPGPEAISESAVRGARNAFASLREIINNWQDQLAKIGLSTESPLADRWQARADMIFEKHNPIADSYQKLASLAQNYPNNPYLYNPDDTAAMVAASRRQNGQVDERTNLAALFQMARKQSPHPTLLLQIAISLSGHHPLEAVNASQLSTKYLGQDHSDISAMCHYYQALLYLQQGMISEAQEKLNTALEIWSDEPRWNALAAEIMDHIGDIRGAIKHLEEAVKFEPKNIKHHLALGRAYLNGIATDAGADVVIYQKRAIRNLERATRLAPQDAEAWLILAQAHYQIGDMNQADECVDHVLEIDSSNYGGLSLKAEVALRSENPAKACDYAKMAALLQPDHPAAHLIHARALESLNSPDEALQALEKAISNSGNSLPLQLEHAGLVKQLHGAQTALEELQSISRQFPDDPEVLVHLAKAYAECDEDDLAIQSAQKSLSIKQGILSDTQQAQMHHLLGCLLRKTGQLDQAILHLHKASKLVPDDVEPYLELGIAHKERRDYQQALQLFQQATTIATHDPRPFYLAGLALKEGKDYRRSEVMLRKAANLAPQDVNIRRQLAAVVALNLVHNPTTVRVNVE